MRAIVLTALLLAPVLAGCLAAEETLAPARRPEQALDPLAFTHVQPPEDIAAKVDAWASLPGVSVDVVGESVEGRPLHKVVLGRGPFVLWAVGRHHGNEPTGAEAILQVVPLLADPAVWPQDDAPPVLRALHAHRELVLDRVTLVLVPVVNPDGASRFVRTNVNGQDLNRDYYLFTQPEPRAVRAAFWEHWPDACLDLHNMGEPPGFDYDAFSPLALMESEVQADLERAAWLAVHEVDAAGGFGGGPNENYRLGRDDVTRQVVNPTAAHPGTHDMFCSIRGAPGWTPEGAIPWAAGEPHEDPAPYRWSTRLHAVTLASALLDAAGLYAGFDAPTVTKTRATLGALGADHLVDVPTRGDLLLQVVWREGTPLDRNVLPVHVEVVDPHGVAHLARMPAPESYTASVRVADAAPGPYRVLVKGPPGLEHEVRMRLVPEQPPVLLASRTADGIRLENPTPRTLRVELSDVVDAPAPDASEFAPAATAVHLWDGKIRPRVGVVWDLTLAPGDVLDVRLADGAAAPGPFRWTATDAYGRVATGVEAARSTGATE